MNALTLYLERSWHFDLTLIFSKKRERLIREDSLEKFPEILGETVSVAEGSFALKCCLMPEVLERCGEGRKWPPAGTVAGDWAQMRVLQWFRGVCPRWFIAAMLCRLLVVQKRS